jgi:hypothetical protein
MTRNNLTMPNKCRQQPPRLPVDRFMKLGHHHRSQRQPPVAVPELVRRTMHTLIAILFVALATHVEADLIQSYSVPSLIGGKEFNSDVTREQLLKTPVWRLQDDLPPLSPRKADKLATAEFQKLVKDPTDFRRRSISLLDMGDHIHWIYVVEFVWNGAFIGPGPSIQIIVLIDGTVIEPKVTVQN